MKNKGERRQARVIRPFQGTKNKPFKLQQVSFLSFKRSRVSIPFKHSRVRKVKNKNLTSLAKQELDLYYIHSWTSKFNSSQGIGVRNEQLILTLVGQYAGTRA